MMTPNAEFSASSMPVKTSTFFFKIFSTLATNNLESVASLIAAVPIILNFFTFKLLNIRLNLCKTLRAKSDPFGSSFPVLSRFFPNSQIAFSLKIGICEFNKLS